ncbi:MAG: hypothetical protein Q9226_001193 [Calogaya cf. arnoldii]
MLLPPTLDHYESFAKKFVDMMENPVDTGMMWDYFSWSSIRLSSIALHGLGGVGKTQSALAYGYRNLDTLDAVFWIVADDAYTVQQDFSRVAVDALKLPNAHPHAHGENMVLVLDWLQKTLSKHGAILVTTRDVVVATLPMDTGLEVNEFGVDQGAGFLLQMTPNRRREDGEINSAEDVARQLGGLPLALNQMAALVNARSVLSFLAADSVPLEVFTPEKPEKLPTSLAFCEDELSLADALDELTHHALSNWNTDRELPTPSIYSKRPRNFYSRSSPQRENEYNDDEWLVYERYIPQVLALMSSYNDSQSNARPLKPNMDFVNLLAVAVNAIHDNDTANVNPWMLATADAAYRKCPGEGRDRLLWAVLQSLRCMYHLSTAGFTQAEEEGIEGLNIRLELLSEDDLLIALSYSWLGMAVGGQERYEDRLQLLLKAGKVLEGPAGETPSRKMVWRYNTSRNYYCMGRFVEAEGLLSLALAEAERFDSWYQQVDGHLTFTSLRTRMGRIDDAKGHVDSAKHILETSGTLARFSWLSSYCAYRAGDVALRLRRVKDAIEESEKSVAIGKLTKIPTSSLARYTHNYAKALRMDDSRQQEAEV